MCFYISSKHPNEKIATKDIVCYKLLYRNLRSTYKYKLYELDKLAKSSITKDINGTIITRGLHSYSCKRFAISQMGRFQEILIKGIIPKGSKYYYNPDRHEYVSNQIILQEIIKKSSYLLYF